ncbi:MAG: YHS domain-containing protein [Candidatus Omnitrophota bacterium]|nr:YHS domain-containing protein [Candidatus Omnitrophota bacterium]
MKSTLMITGILLMLLGGGHVFAQMENPDASETKAVEVGNKICPVSGEKIAAPGEKNEMGGAVQYEYNGKIYNFCCPMCIKDFKKNPEKYSKIAEDEAAKEKMMQDGEEQKNHSDPGHK